MQIYIIVDKLNLRCFRFPNNWEKYLTHQPSSTVTYNSLKGFYKGTVFSLNQLNLDASQNSLVGGGGGGGGEQSTSKGMFHKLLPMKDQVNLIADLSLK